MVLSAAVDESGRHGPVARSHEKLSDCKMVQKCTMWTLTAIVQED